jgi:hypothetical protein
MVDYLDETPTTLERALELLKKARGRITRDEDVIGEIIEPYTLAAKNRKLAEDNEQMRLLLTRFSEKQSIEEMDF